MNKIKYILLLAVSAMIMFSCEQKDILFSEDMSCVGFYGEKASVLEVDKDMSGKDTVTVQLLVTTLPGAPSVDISLEVDVEGIANPATEGVDFEILSGKTITVAEGYGYAPVVIAALDNDKYDQNGNKSFKLKVVSNSQGYDLSSESVMTITIVDDDHPLGWLFGDYDVTLTETANGSANHAVSIVGVEGEVDKVKIYGMCSPPYGPPASDPYFILGTVSDDYSSISFVTGQEWESWNYGSATLTAYNDDNGDDEEADTLDGVIDRSNGVSITFTQAYTFVLGEPNPGVGISWAYNSDDPTDSETAVWIKQ